MQDFAEYFQTVLGVKQLLVRQNTTGSAMATLDGQPQNPASLVKMIFVEDFQTYTTLEKELLQKVLAAVGLPCDGYLVTGDPQNISRSILVFLDSIAHEINSAEFEFPSPRLMLRDASLKKQCWQKLQEWMKSSSSKTNV